MIIRHRYEFYFIFHDFFILLRRLFCVIIAVFYLSVGVLFFVIAAFYLCVGDSNVQNIIDHIETQ